MNHRILLAALLASTALTSAGVAQTAAPQTNARQPAATQPVRDARAQGGMTAAPTDFGTVFAGQGGEGTRPDGSTGKDLGGGLMIEEEAPKTRSTVTRDHIAKMAPAANPYQMVEMLPGANVAGPTAFGFNGGNITLRGFNSDQLGMTIEGAPVNDSGNYALFPQEYVDPENMGQISIAQGTPDLDSPHIGATGGVMNLYMRDPSKTAGGFVGQSIGSHLASRTFVRLETGQIGKFRGFLSYSNFRDNHWTGPGHDNRHHVDMKGVVDIDAGNRISFSLIYNEALNNNYLNPTLAQFNTPGFRPSYLSALPTTFFSGADRTINNAANYYGFRINPFRNLIASAPSTFTLTDKLTFDTVPYFWYGFGNGGGTSTMTEQVAGSTTGSGVFYGTQRITGVDWNRDGTVTNGQRVLFYNPSVTETYRPGFINKLTYNLGEHKIVAGHWFEYATHKQTAPYAALGADGSIINPFMRDGFVIPTGPFAGSQLQRRDWQTKTMTNVLFLGDTWTTLNDRLIIEGGIKQAFINRELNNYLPGVANPRVTINNAVTLPQLGARYKLNNENQVFASLGTSFRSLSNFVLADQYSTTTGALTQAANPKLKPEKAVTLELGHRYQGEMFATSVSAFGTRYSNRQVSTNILDPSGGTSTISTNLNAGDVTSYGLDFEVGTRRLWNAWRFYGAGEVMHTRLENNLRTTNTAGAVDYLPTRGKALPRAPGHMFSLGADYDDGRVFGGLTLKYIGPQYATFMNDQKMKAFSTLNGSLGYRFANYGVMKTPELRLNLYNILDSRRLTGVNGVQTNALATRGLNGGTIGASSAPTYYMGQGFAAMVTLQSGF